MEMLQVLSRSAASACLGVAFLLTFVDFLVYSFGREQFKLGGCLNCLGQLLTGLMLLLSLLFILLANLLVR